MQLKQTNSAITFLLSEYRSIFRSAYTKGLTAAMVVAVPTTPALAASAGGQGTQPDDTLDLSSAFFDANLDAATEASASAATEALAAGSSRPIALENGSSLSFVSDSTQSDPGVVSAASSSSTAQPDALAAPAPSARQLIKATLRS